MTIHIGFTGTQRGTTLPQRNAVATILECLDETDLHHGNCIGSDEEIDAIVRPMGYRIHLHRATTGRKQAKCDIREGFDVDYPAKAPLVRNRDVADPCHVLIATPGEMAEILGSGTWSTVRYARKRGKRVIIIFPDGSISDTAAAAQ